MNVTKTTRIHFMMLALSFPLVLMLFAADAECAQGGQESSEELLLRIMDLHTELVTNEIFLAQAKLLGGYVEAAQLLEEAKKVEIYAKVLNILTKIKDSETQTKEKPKSGDEEKSTEEEKPESKTVYEPGAALLEIFKLTGNETSLENIPELPVIRTYWKSGLACSGFFPLPDRASKVGINSPYVAKFSFYYEAKKAGKYGFNVTHFCGSGSFGRSRNACKLTIGNVDIVEVSSEPVGQGVCDLKKGFHRVEFLLISKVPYWKDVPGKQMANFNVEIMTPDAFDAVPLTKEMMLLKKE